MADTAAVQKTPKQTVLDVLGLMVGADLIRALEIAFDTDDFTSLQSTLPALGSAGVRALHQPAFEAACAQGRADVAQVLLASDSVNAAATVDSGGMNVPGGPHTLLQHAVQNDCPDVVRVLLTDASVEATVNANHGEDAGIYWEANAPLLLAAEFGHVECLQTLLASAHVDIHAVGPLNDMYLEEGLPVTPLGFAARGGHLPCVRALLAAEGSDVNYMGEDENSDAVRPMSALMEAATYDQVPCLLALLDADGVDINLQDEVGRTALAFACGRGNIGGGSESAAEALLAVEGIDANLADSDGRRPLGGAVGSTMFHTVQLLLQRKEVDANAANEDGTTPLHNACRQNHAGMVRALLLGGGCRFKLTTDKYYLRQGTAGDGTPLGMTTDADVRTLFASGIDYWQRKHHAHHSWATKHVVLTLLLVAQRICVHAAKSTQSGDPHTPVQHPPLSLPLMPEEIWLELLGFLRSADFKLCVTGLNDIENHQV